MAYDLLVEPILSWRDAQRQRGKTSLPGTLALLASGELVDFSRLRTHQLDPWCMFLTQLAAIALHRARQSDPQLPEDEWRELLLALSEGAHEPWSLVVPDVTKPAFFQPPVPEGTISSWKRRESPDGIDILVTAKGHDVKTELLDSTDLEAWAYALCTLQTVQGYPGGAGRYHGVARMNGGYGNRPHVGLAPDLSLSSRFRRDVEVLLDSWPILINRGFSDKGVALVWTEPWDSRHSLAMHDLAPHFIEVCWRVRCQEEDDAILCLYTTTHVRRCLPETDTGDVGDPWIPIERAGQKALTVASNGFDYRVLTRLLFEGDFEPAAAQQARPDDGDPVLFLASALARGQGKTEGLHERTLVFSGTARRKLGEPDGRALLGRRAAARVASTAVMRSKVLYRALTQLTPRMEPMADDLDARVDDIFFDHLFQTFEMDDDAARVAFDQRLEDLARAELQRAIDRSPTADARRLKAISDAERIFQAALKKHFHDLVTSPLIAEGAQA